MEGPGCLDPIAAAALIEDHVTPSRGNAIDRHLAECDRCRRLVAALAASHRGEGAMGTEAGSHDLRAGGDDVYDQTPRPDRVGRYELGAVIGVGAMGAVYRAWDPRLGRDVAVKLVRAEEAGGEPALERLSREARALARLSHPHVVAVYDAGVVDGLVYIAMELVSGETLASWLSTRDRGTEAILRMLAHAAEGLAAAHAAGVVHRDVKPTNLVVGTDGRLRVVDFGLARVVVAALGAAQDHAIDDTSRAGISDATRRVRGVVETRAVVGTPAYMAPEQRDGGGDERSDQYALCVTAWEALFGSRPGHAGVAVGPRRVPAPVVRALRRGLAPEPARRHPDLGALAAILAPRHSRRVAVAAAAAVVLGSGAFVALGGDGAEPSPCIRAARTASPWDAEARERTRVRFTADEAVEGASAFDRVDVPFGRWRDRWRDATIAACALPERARDVRRTCLDAQGVVAARLVERLAAADPRVIALAGGAVAGLPDPDACLRAREHGAAVAPGALVALIDRMATVEVDLLLGRFDTVAAAAAALEADAVAAGAPEVAARAAVHAAAALHKLLQLDATAAALARAADHAARAPDDRLLAQVWLRHAELLAFRHQVEAASAMLGAATAAATRVGPDDALRAEVALARANVLWETADIPAAIDEFGRALALQRATLGPDHPAVATTQASLGAAQCDDGDAASCERNLGEAIVLLTSRLGEHHYDVLRARTFLGAAQVAAGRPRQAIASLEAVVVAIERSLGGGYGDLSYPLMYLGRARLQLGMVEPAITALRRAVDLFARTYGADDPNVAMGSVDLVRALWARDTPADRREALSLARDVRRIYLAHGRPAMVERVDAWVAAVAPNAAWP